MATLANGEDPLLNDHMTRVQLRLIEEVSLSGLNARLCTVASGATCLMESLLQLAF